tara:strand:+ start:1009 stop:1260 length:252 start_codon:yes stop_codon:yes gene_type:complete
MNWDNITKNVYVKRLLKERIKLENKIKSIDENALINYELEVLTIPVVVGQSEQFYCVSSSALVYGKPCSEWCGDENCKTLCKQ